MRMSLQPRFAMRRAAHASLSGGPGPERLLLDVLKPTRCCWPKPDSIPEREPGRGSGSEYSRVHVARLCLHVIGRACLSAAHNHDAGIKALAIVAQERTFLASC
jgi:hypothetical protein